MESAGVSKLLSLDVLMLIGRQKLRYPTGLHRVFAEESSPAVAELERAHLQAGFPPGTRLPTIPLGAFEKNSKIILGIGSYAPIREVTQVIDHMSSERDTHDEEGAAFGCCCVGLSLNATMSMSQEDGSSKVRTCLVDISSFTAVWKNADPEHSPGQHQGVLCQTK